VVSRPLTPEEQFAKSRDTDLKAIDAYNQSHPLVTDYSGIVYDVEQSVSAEELSQMGYPPGTEIRYKYVKPGPGSTSKDPVKVFTVIPPSAPAPYPRYCAPLPTRP